jgi:hypothetical protein
MLQFFKTLLMGNELVRSNQREHPEIRVQVINLYRVWRNKGYRDFGIERLIRLFLIASQFVFPGLYVRHIGAKYGGFLGRRLAVEIYILFKLMLPVLVFAGDFGAGMPLLMLIAYLLVETMLYLTSLIFLSFQFSAIVSYRRSLISLFINFMEISLNYGLVYFSLAKCYKDFFNKSFDSGLEAVYFSFITSATIGYGDIFPVHTLARVLVLSQVVFSFVFIGLIFNYFAARAHLGGDYSHIPGKKKAF